MKYGIDFLLYASEELAQSGGEHQHAPYSVIVRASGDKMTWRRLQSCSRLASQVRLPRSSLPLAFSLFPPLSLPLPLPLLLLLILILSFSFSLSLSLSHTHTRMSGSKFRALQVSKELIVATAVEGGAVRQLTLNRWEPEREHRSESNGKTPV